MEFEKSWNLVLHVLNRLQNHHSRAPGESEAGKRFFQRRVCKKPCNYFRGVWGQRTVSNSELAKSAVAGSEEFFSARMWLHYAREGGLHWCHVECFVACLESKNVFSSFVSLVAVLRWSGNRWVLAMGQIPQIREFHAKNLGLVLQMTTKLGEVKKESVPLTCNQNPRIFTIHVPNCYSSDTRVLLVNPTTPTQTSVK